MIHENDSLFISDWNHQALAQKRKCHLNPLRPTAISKLLNTGQLSTENRL